MDDPGEKGRRLVEAPACKAKRVVVASHNPLTPFRQGYELGAAAFGHREPWLRGYLNWLALQSLNDAGRNHLLRARCHYARFRATGVRAFRWGAWRSVQRALAAQRKATL